MIASPDAVLVENCSDRRSAVRLSFSRNNENGRLAGKQMNLTVEAYAISLAGEPY